jgi:hypothetical protein
MKALSIQCLIVIILLLMGTPDARASADFRCNSEIISIGDRRQEVLRKCGEPTSVDVWDEVRIKRDFGSRYWPRQDYPGRIPLLVEELVQVEEWEYNLGPGKFIRYLRFENGWLTRITLGDYGY